MTEYGAFPARSEEADAAARAYLAAAEATTEADLPLVPLCPTIERAAVVGAGVMGTGIALTLAAAGIAVHLIDPSAAQRTSAKTRIADLLAGAVRRGRQTTDDAQACIARIQIEAGLDAAAGADLAIEAVVEEPTVKVDVLAALDRIAAPAAIFASNTSTLDIDVLAAATGRPASVLGLHFFHPAHIMRLVEIVPGAATAGRTTVTAAQLARRIGKVGVLAGNREGFIGNRILYAFRREAESLLEEGASPAQVDGVLVEFGFAMGPFAVADLAGLDISWRARLRANALASPAGRTPRVADRLCEMGRFGQKTGAGFYRYFAGDRTPHPDPAVDDLIRTVAEAVGIRRRTIDEAEIRERCVLALVGRAIDVLAEGTAQRVEDVDLVWTLGYGFPAAQGGPLYLAGKIGPAALVARLRRLEREHGDRWTPHPDLVAVARRGGTIDELTRRPRS